MSKSLSLYDDSLTPFSVGFDSIFDRLYNTIEYGQQGSKYPPYNIKKKSDYLYEIELAVAGFGKKEISILKEKEVLIIKGEQEKEESKEFVHQGLSSRNFTRRFTLADDIVVNGADMKDGILKVSLERIVPEEDKPQEIKIS